MSGSLEKRFRRKLSEPTATGCLEWRGWKNNSGYGIIKSSAQPYRHLLAHRVAYELHYGPIPEGLEVRHSCDNKACANFAHLSVGTHKDNMKDMLDRDRQRKSQFSVDDVNDMRRLRAMGLTQGEIALEYKVSRPLISMLFSGRITPSAE